MIGRNHHYATSLRWTGNRGTGTSGYREYGRSYDLASEGKPTLAGSSDPAFRGDAAKWNPEEMLLSALSSCHMLSYLHLCADAGIVVLSYTDDAAGTMELGSDDAAGTMELGSDDAGRFTSVTLRPQVTVAEGTNTAEAQRLHHTAHEKCFIANSVNFPVACEATIMQNAVELQNA